jgi:hypothetical protein
MSDKTSKSQPNPPAPARPRRPYAKPRVESRPLFERMALTCNFDEEIGEKVGDS